MALENALGVLVGKRRDQSLAAFAETMSKQGLATANYTRMVSDLRGCSSWEDVAQGVVAMVAFNPLQSARVLDALYWELATPDLPTGQPFAMGAILGIFEAGVWLDEQWRNAEMYDSALPGSLASCLASPKLDRRSLRPEVIEAEEKDDDRYNGRLSQVVKKFVQGGNNRGTRRNTSFEIIAVARRLFVDGDTATPYLTEVLIDQVCYALFADISMDGRVQALDELFVSLLPPVTATPTE